MLVSTVSGAIFFADGGLDYGIANPWVYSLLYNALSVGVDTVLCVLVALLPPVRRVYERGGLRRALTPFSHPCPAVFPAPRPPSPPKAAAGGAGRPFDPPAALSPSAAGFFSSARRRALSLRRPRFAARAQKLENVQTIRRFCMI